MTQDSKQESGALPFEGYDGPFTLSTENDHAQATARKEFRERHGNPSGPFYSRCTNCGEIRERDYALLDVLHDVKRHAGVHGGLNDEQAEIIVTDAHGLELFRQHAIHRPKDQPDGCPTCGEKFSPVKRITCPGCGRIADRHIDGGEASAE